MIAHVWKRNHLKPDCINYCFWVFILQLYLNKLVLLLGVYFPIQLQFYLRNCFTLMFTFYNSNCVYRTGFTFRWFVRYRWLLQQLKSQFKRSRNPLERKFTKMGNKKKRKRQRKIERDRGKGEKNMIDVEKNTKLGSCWLVKWSACLPSIRRSEFESCWSLQLLLKRTKINKKEAGSGSFLDKQKIERDEKWRTNRWSVR